MNIKAIITVLAGLAVGASAQAQGLVNFNNSGGSRVILMETGMAPAPGTTIAGLYYSRNLTDIPNPGAVADDFTLVTTTPVSTSATMALWGLFAQSNVIIPDAPAGSQVLLQVRAWSVGYNSYEDALTRGTQADEAGFSNLMGPVTLGGGGLPVPATSGLLIGNIVLVPIPEPSTIALGLLGGLGALVLMRRRN